MQCSALPFALWQRASLRAARKRDKIPDSLNRFGMETSSATPRAKGYSCAGSKQSPISPKHADILRNH